MKGRVGRGVKPCWHFTAEEVRATLDGCKRQYRQLAPAWAREEGPPPMEAAHVKPGDVVWVKEPWHVYPRQPGQGMEWRCYGPSVYGVAYKADGGWGVTRWRAPCLMPRWAARLWVRVLEVRPQRLHCLTEEEAQAEGYESREAFRTKWNRGHKQAHSQWRYTEADMYRHEFEAWVRGEKEWGPWVWVRTFELAERPEELGMPAHVAPDALARR